MQYSKQDILKVWESCIGPLAKLPHEGFFNICTADMFVGVIRCPKCKHGSSNTKIYKLNGIWSCGECHGFTRLRSHQRRAIDVFRLTNDLISLYGDPIDSQVLFDPEYMSSLVEFAGLSRTPAVYVLFMDFLRTIFQQEVGTLKIVGFLNKSQKQIDRLRSRVDATSPQKNAE